MKLKGTGEFTNLKRKKANYFIKKEFKNMLARGDTFDVCRVMPEINSILKWKNRI